MLFTEVSQVAELAPFFEYPPDLYTVLFEVRPWHEVQEVTMSAVVTGFGAGGVQDWVRTGEPPVQPAGDEVATVRVCWPLAGQVAGVHAL
jgi:hypothetical protein